MGIRCKSNGCSSRALSDRGEYSTKNGMPLYLVSRDAHNNHGRQHYDAGILGTR
jgi:hypothetical protein